MLQLYSLDDDVCMQSIFLHDRLTLVRGAFDSNLSAQGNKQPKAGLAEV